MAYTEKAVGSASTSVPAFDVFLSHDHADAEVVEEIGRLVRQKYGYRVWLDRWVLVPGGNWQQEMAKGLGEAATCAVFIGRQTAQGWFRQEIERALNNQATQPDYRVIPVLLPDAPAGDPGAVLPGFLELRTWVDFRAGLTDSYALHLLRSGIAGTAPGPWPPLEMPNLAVGGDVALDSIKRELRELDQLKDLLHETVIIEMQRRILSRRFT